MRNLSSYYDLIASITKNDEVTGQELALVQEYLRPPGSKILDVGCGTGRHLIPLIELGYDLEGLDSNKIHLEILRSKLNKKIRLYEQEFNKASLKGHYNALILFWNSLNEICHTPNELDSFLNKAKDLLNKNGLIIINIDDITKFDPKKLDFTYEGEFEGNNFKYEFKIQEFDNEQNISKSLECLEIFNGPQPINLKANLIQKWWHSAEITSIAKKYGFISETSKIKANNEIYLILTKS
jgi:SAM-dependent methyltransferase